jgi:hypothetical protein
MYFRSVGTIAGIIIGSIIGLVIIITIIVAICATCTKTAGTRGRRVPCCDVSYDFHIKTIFGSSLPPVVCRRVHILFTLCMLACV